MDYYKNKNCQPPYPPNSFPPSNYHVWAILTTIFCCLPFGIVAIVYSGKVNGLWYAGRQEDAYDAARKARMWTIISAVAGLVAGVVYSIVMFNTNWESLAG